MATGIYTLADLSAAEWTKIQPGLRSVLEKLNESRSVSIRDWAQGHSIFPWIPAPSMALGLWYEHADGSVYALYEDKLPMSWTGAQYIDYVIKLVKSPYVLRVGQIGEFFGMPVFWTKHIKLNSVQDFIDRAYTAPQTIQPSPSPTPTPGPSPTPTPEPYPTPTPGPYPSPYPTPSPGPVGFERYALWGVIGLSAVIVLAAIMSRPREEPEKKKVKAKARKGGR